MIFGGLEIVAGGYFAHKYYKNKNDKKRQEDEAQYRRNHTFPSNAPSSCYPHPQFQHQEQLPHYQRPQYVAAPQKHACYAPTQSLSQGQRPQQQLRPQTNHAQSFNIPRRPVPERKPEIIIQPGLQRADSMATLSRMPIANGYRPSDQTGPMTSHQGQTESLLPVQQSPYGNSAFSASSPAFGATPTSPPIRYVMAPERRETYHTAENSWEAFEGGNHRVSAYAPTEASTQLGEHDPPPPYLP
ncbi:hypothetical protein E8E13_009011 [Curvularia kusanoi]|uniref:Uncharacterized protein n=1 Tax=Curvularia kusanoi TaxID=90978 RepID=A0A9P4TL80_CURKU|nr:hypothetical protein E8E13_009011 [Curvularia kusanoi]